MMSVRATTFAMRMSVCMLVEKHQTNDIDSKAKHRHKEKVWSDNLLRLVYSFNRLDKHIESYENQENSIKQTT